MYLTIVCQNTDTLAYLFSWVEISDKTQIFYNYVSIF